MKFIIHLSRIIVGNLFIFSGIVKANDPLGLSYKLEEYFIEFGMNWAWLHEILVPLATVLVIVEIVLGIAVLVGYRMKIVSALLLLMIVFFTILTGASAIYDIVRECGCFGDAIPLTPWQSFYKDLILLVFIILIFIKRNEIKPFESSKTDLAYFLITFIIMGLLSVMLDWYFPMVFVLIVLGVGVLIKPKIKERAAGLTVILSLLGSLWLSIDAIEHLPPKDFRAYAIGKNLPEQMTLPPDAKPSVFENILTYKNTVTGEEKSFTMEEYNAQRIWENKDWEWVSTETELIEQGDEAKITDFSITDSDGIDYTDVFLNEPNVFMLIMYDLSATETENFEQINKFANEAQEAGMKFIALSAAGYAQANDFRHQHQTPFDFYITDGIVLKTIIRSNPGLVYLENGTVVGKWHENDIPTFTEVKENYIQK